MASAKDNMKALIDQRDRLRMELEALRNKIAGIDLAISIIQSGATASKEDPVPVSRRTGVKGFVLDLLKERGVLGLNAQIAVDIAATRGVLMDRASVSSLLSRLKQDGAVEYENGLYRLKGLLAVVQLQAALAENYVSLRDEENAVLGRAL